MGVIGEWICALAVLALGAIIWRQQHVHLDGQAIGPLKRVFRVNRRAVILWTVLALALSAVFWGLPLLPVWYRIGLMVLLLFGMLAYIPIWNWRLRRMQQEMESDAKQNPNSPLFSGGQTETLPGVAGKSPSCLTTPGRRGE